MVILVNVEKACQNPIFIPNKNVATSTTGQSAQLEN